MTVRMTISMPDALAEMVERLVSEGKYASHSDVIRDGLRALEARKEEHEQKLALLRADLQARLEGEFISHEEMNERVDAMLNRLKAESRKRKSA